ncbi:hypothetical protein J3R83DRAFT_11536 [Lanmaoa asiatica]|nr:hypothetical protein J3R83DRAFT_11536 [Lanmaoa asiatica]
MAAPPIIPDGVYKFLNVEFPIFAADLIHGNPLGTVSGYTNNDASRNNKWKIVNIGSTGNEITIESVAAPGYFAYAFTKLSGDPITGFSDPMVWNVDQVAENQYQFQTGKLVWELPGGYDYLTILLRPNKFEPTQKWALIQI